ncbi:dephospho-CoA kinase [Serpentinicella sp. ANB-PHB4]|uniref:dephospho-CoA kinase n=1 Tax=Serpentinicella sp. ANB-PHB4 TaxID=3074076 RepID=UPI00285A8F77|nr:dephospho-CoA kinase [Serpentinicella sp. ANB-PHB4]MDR5657949.1 dephospho-CoA kinase [Serpentinicella sp. ANB-PHB4]
MFKVIGLTGSVASGKSTVSSILSQLGAIIIDADKVARKIVNKGEPALQQIINTFGSDIVDEQGELKRKKLGNIVFNSKDELEKLNQITHPKIIEEIQNEINWYKHRHIDSVIIIDAALLIELNMHTIVDETWVVYVPLETQIQRLVNRDDIRKEDALRRIDTQMTNQSKLQYADKVINNVGSIEELEDEVRQCWDSVMKSK